MSTNGREADQLQLKGLQKPPASLPKLPFCKVINDMLKPEVKEPSLAYIITPVLARVAFSVNTLVFRVIWNVTRSPT